MIVGTSVVLGEYRLGVSFFNRGQHVLSKSDYLTVRSGPETVLDMVLVCRNLTGQYDEVRYDIRRDGVLVKRGREFRRKRVR